MSDDDDFGYDDDDDVIALCKSPLCKSPIDEVHGAYCDACNARD